MESEHLNLKHRQVCTQTVQTGGKLFLLLIIMAITHYIIEFKSFDGPLMRQITGHRLPRNRSATTQDLPKTNEKRQQPKDKKVILFWTKRYDWPVDGMVKQVSSCKPRACLGTSDRNLVNVSDAVLFHQYHMTGRGGDKLPSFRTPDQRWVVWGIEPPPQTSINGTFWSGLLNWTMSYRRDADFWTPYRTYAKVRRKGKGKKAKSRAEWARGKPRGAVAVVSHCTPRRMHLIQRLSALTQVDVFGRCFDKVICPDKEEACFREFLKPYRFYLSIENSYHCKDYLSEKYWMNALGHNIVPVVAGPSLSNMREVGIPGSYIHVDELGSVEALAAHLNKLIADDDAYGAYFDWKESYVPKGAGFVLCEMCRKLHENPPRKIYKNFTKWWYTCNEHY